MKDNILVVNKRNVNSNENLPESKTTSEVLTFDLIIPHSYVQRHIDFKGLCLTLKVYCYISTSLLPSYLRYCLLHTKTVFNKCCERLHRKEVEAQRENQKDTQSIN